MAEAGEGRGRGRPAVSSRADIEDVALRLFTERGYSATTIPMIAASSGVSRTTVFRYWGSKSDIVWGEFDLHIQRLSALLDADLASGDGTLSVVQRVIVANLGASIESSRAWFARFALVDRSEELRAEEARHWADWAATVASFVARRHGWRRTDVVPQSVAGAVQGAFLAVLRDSPDDSADAARVLPVLDRALASLAAVLQPWIDDGAAADRSGLGHSGGA
jgi:AcrR family transcriptional regulator